MHSLRTIRDYARRHGAIWVFDAAQLSAGAAATLPAMLRHTRGSSGATVQTGTSAVVTGLGTDVAGVGRALDADPLGVVVEMARQNIVTAARSQSGWVAGSGNTPTDSYATGPDGTPNAATRSVVTSGGYSRLFSAGVLFGAYTASAWSKPTSGGNVTSQIGWAGGGAGDIWNGATTTPVAWQRWSATSATGYSFYFRPVSGENGSASGGIAAGARDACTDLYQVEQGGFPTEVIVSTSGATTRAGARLWLPYSALVTQGGRLELRLILQAKGAHTDYASSPYLWRIDASNYATISNSTGKVTIVIAGASYTTASGVTWAQGDVLDLRIGCGGGVMQTFVECSKNGAAKTSLGTTSAQAALPVNGVVDLLQDGSAANVLSCRLRKAYAYAPGTLQGIA